ncbi:MFS transporter [Streptosporangium roseum]|uniref:Major facilitator transporter n=1 Tax=Streptosporangium roseum (strain ATCC 12428 / DSM 43021 / JCM 3005 / KCTC 9067 / NCIMB 10171 / NRRL 2505 / NI 9100) TaxID=479432 RepID=D2AUQ1_STRRD|nr:MFS transporter [Streptosporangium roseum]ACZ84913.1 major facilitator transporter [Streptosporangium roseum DSM 43021]
MSDELRKGQTVNLALATAAFAITFWAWNLIGPLAGSYSRQLGLSPTQTSLLVAIPVLVGSLGRIPVGMLADRLGGRLMFAIVCAVTIVPVLFVGWVESYGWLLFWGFLLGVGGTSFAVGIPFVNAWYAPARRGFATGVFGAGMGGTALSAFLTPRLVESAGRMQTHLLMAAALAVMAVVMLLFSRNSPAWKPSTAPALPRMREAVKIKATWQCAFLYAVAFGGFVAFSTYLPTLLQNVYGFSQTGAGLRDAGFSIAAVAARPLGGVLSDRMGPARVLLASFAGTTVMALVLAFNPPPEIPAGTCFVLMALFLGLGTGGVFALVARLVEPSRVGTVTGLVGAAGGLGGYFPPLVMGVVYSATGTYVIGYVLLAATALAALLYTRRAFTSASTAGGGAATR